MSTQVDFYFDYGSPTSYLAYVQLPGLVARTGAIINHRPVLLGGIFQATGNRSPMDVPAKRKWMVADMAFFAARYKVPFAINPYFPINTLNLMRGAIFAQNEGFLREYSDAVFSGIWVERRNLGDVAEVREVLATAGLAVDAMLAATQQPLIKEALKTATDAAVGRGVFGVPAMFVGDVMFFGQDRLRYIEEAIQGSERKSTDETPPGSGSPT